MTTYRAEAAAVALATPPDITGASLSVDSLVARGVSFRGSAHELFDEPRQDSFVLTSNQDWLVIVVSDGIGSCEHSHHGSAAAVNAIARAIEAGELDPQDGTAVLATAARAGIAVADTLGASTRTVSATLSVAAVERSVQDDGTRHVIVHAVGDSPGMLLEPAAARWIYLTQSHDGPSNVVRSWIPDRHDEFVSVGASLPPGAILVVASDGFTTPLGDGTGPLGVDLAARWGQGPRELFPFMVDLSFNAYHDDKTVVAVWNSATASTDDEPCDGESEGGEGDV